MISLKFHELFDVGQEVAFSVTLDEVLQYGLYENALLARSNAERSRFLVDYVEGQLFTDILGKTDVRNTDAMAKLLITLSTNIGRDLSIHSLGNSIGVNDRTLRRYIDLLKDANVIIETTPFRGVSQREVCTKNKFYFTDHGVRNALINDFSSPYTRVDNGRLWENFIISQRYALGLKHEQHFWRNYDNQHLDYIEIEEGKTDAPNIHAYEIRWFPTSTLKPPPKFEQKYPTSTFEVVTPRKFANLLNTEQRYVDSKLRSVLNAGDYVI